MIGYSLFHLLAISISKIEHDFYNIFYLMPASFCHVDQFFEDILTTGRYNHNLLSFPYFFHLIFAVNSLGA